MLYMSKGEARCQNEKVAINLTSTLRAVSLHSTHFIHEMHILLLPLWFLDSKSNCQSFDVFRFE